MYIIYIWYCCVNTEIRKTKLKKHILIIRIEDMCYGIMEPLVRDGYGKIVLVMLYFKEKDKFETLYSRFTL